MIKRIIFDIDNTLIKWENSYYDELGKVFDILQMSYTSSDVEKIIEAIEEYENRESYFNKDAMLQLCEEKIGKTLPNNFIDTMLAYFATCVPEQLPLEEVETLKYLSSKYELVTLTNWFEETQKIRLKKVGIEKFFKDMYACEKIKIKPNKESYLTAAGKNKPEECLMVGDSLTNDIEGAEKCGMQVMYVNPQKLPTKYPNIQTLEELKERL